jgi:pyridoxamine 5'-phosphate oxidase
LLKQFDQMGFVFFTNYDSDKAKGIEALPRAELVFHWDALGRQVRIQGELSRLDAAASDQYFASRARDSQIGAWASLQSRPVESTDSMNRRWEEVKAKFEGKEVPRPENWGGYRLKMRRMEFWLADEFRFHDRFRYYINEGKWEIKQIYP